MNTAPIYLFALSLILSCQETDDAKQEAHYNSIVIKTKEHYDNRVTRGMRGAQLTSVCIMDGSSPVSCVKNILDLKLNNGYRDPHVLINSSSTIECLDGLHYIPLGLNGYIEVDMGVAIKANDHVRVAIMDNESCSKGHQFELYGVDAQGTWHMICDGKYTKTCTIQ